MRWSASVCGRKELSFSYWVKEFGRLFVRS